jgi:hypothetical protein
VFSVLAALACLVLAVLLVRNWHSGLNQVVFRKPVFKIVVVGCAGLSMLLAVFGTALGFNSAGQRRNNRQRLSWTGFFLGSGVFTLAVVLFAAFWFLKFQLKAQGG